MSIYQLPPEVTDWLVFLYAPLTVQKSMGVVGSYMALRDAGIHLLGDLITHTDGRLTGLFKRREKQFVGAIEYWLNSGQEPITVLDGTTYTKGFRLRYRTKEVPRPLGLRLGINSLNDIEPGLGARFWHGRPHAEAVACTFYDSP